MTLAAIYGGDARQRRTLVEDDPSPVGGSALVTAFLGYIGAGNYVGLDRQLGERVSPSIRRWLLSGDPHVAAATQAAPPASAGA